MPLKLYTIETPSLPTAIVPPLLVIRIAVYPSISVIYQVGIAVSEVPYCTMNFPSRVLSSLLKKSMHLRRNRYVPGLIALIILAILVLIVIVENIHIVLQSRAYVVERLGAFHAGWNVGLHFKLPFIIMRVAKKVSLKEQVVDIDPQSVITKDNVTMQIDTVIYFQITDPKLYTYGVEYPLSAIENLTATTLRNIIGDMEFDQSLTSRDVINTRMRSFLDEATDPWKIKVNHVELKNIIPPKEIQNAMEKQMKAERERR